MNPDFELILEDCLKRLRIGQSTEECLAAYPDQAESLRSLLLTASHVRGVPAPQPRSQAILAGKARMLDAAKSNSKQNSFALPVSSGDFSRYSVRILTNLKTLLFGKEIYGMKFALRLTLDLVIILIVGGLLSINASAHSLPGDTLYSVKRTWEQVRLSLTLDDPDRLQLQDQIRELRLDEVREMIQMGRPGTVEFQGQLQSINANEWAVSGIRVGMFPDTIVVGNPEIGQTVQVRARVQNDGTLTALQVRNQTQTQLLVPYPTPLSTHTPIATPAPSLTPWPTHEPTHAPTYQPTQQHGPNYNHHDSMPGPTAAPHDEHHNDDDHHHNSGGSSSMGDDSGSHHSKP